MIVLVQPNRPSSVISGGFLYNEEIRKRLLRDSAGRAVEIDYHGEPDPVAIGLFPKDIVVFDSLFLEAPDPEEVIGRFTGARRILLLHYLPSTNPRLGKAEREEARAVETRLLGAMDGVITPTHWLAGKVRENLDPKRTIKVHVAPPGLGDPVLRAQPAERSPGELMILAVGPLCEDKGQLEIARALAALPQQPGPLRLLLVGDREKSPSYSAEVLAQGGGGLTIEAVGCLDPAAVAELMARADLYVSASSYESYGMATAEAACLGVPIVASRVGGVESFVSEGRNALLFDALDHGEMRRHLASVLESREALDAFRSPRTPPGLLRSWEDTWSSFRGACQSEVDAALASDQLSFFSACELPTDFGSFTVQIYRSADGEESLFIHRGDLHGDEPLFLRVHSECFTGEVLHSLKCDCRPQLLRALATIAERQRGAVIYLRQEGRGIGLGNKIAAYAEQAKGADTVEANETLGFAADLREFTMAARILELNGVKRVELNTNNPEKVDSLRRSGIQVERVIPSRTELNPHNQGYLRTKYEKLGHLGLRELLTPPPSP